MRLFPLNSLALAVVAICTAAHAQVTPSTAASAPQTGDAQQGGDAQGKTPQRANTSTTSNTTNANASQRAIEQATQLVTVVGVSSVAFETTLPEAR